MKSVYLSVIFLIFSNTLVFALLSQEATRNNISDTDTNQLKNVSSQSSDKDKPTLLINQKDVPLENNITPNTSLHNVFNAKPNLVINEKNVPSKNNIARYNISNVDEETSLQNVRNDKPNVINENDVLSKKNIAQNTSLHNVSNDDKPALVINQSKNNIDQETSLNKDEKNIIVKNIITNDNNTVEEPSVTNSTFNNNPVSALNETNATSAENIVPGEPVLPEKGAAEEERNSSIAIFFVLCVLALGILLIHLMLLTHFHYLPESITIVFLGALIGLILNLMSVQNISNWRKEEAFSPTAFFLVLLPPIIFESGYNLHKGNFFQNIGSILVFAILGTTISALVIGAGIYILGLAEITYRLSFVESFAFGSLISAVDPVATVAIFHALDIDPVLNMLVFGESILNDAIAIVLTSSILRSNSPDMSTSEAVLTGINQFFSIFFASAGIGVLFALTSALLLKYVDLRKHPSLEFGMMLVFTYAPYALAEGIHLSGIMAILFNGVVMSHYTHFNLSTVTQITMQQTMRTLAFIAETCVFAYLGLALFSFRHRFEPALVIWSIILCLIGRACNIYPLAVLCNKFREHQITKRMMFIMWFSGLRGAISYALSLHLEFSDETRHVIITTTLIIVLVTTLFFGGSTMPLMKVLQQSKPGRKTSRKKSRGKGISLSKTKEWGQAIDSEHFSEYTEEELEVNFNQSRIGGFAKWDIKYFTPFFTRRFTQQELKDCKTQMTDLTNQWYQAIRISPMDSEEDKSRSPS